MSSDAKRRPGWDQTIGDKFRDPSGAWLMIRQAVDGCQLCVYEGVCPGGDNPVIPCGYGARSDKLSVIFVAVPENEIPIKPGGHDTPIGEKFRDEARPDVVLEVVDEICCEKCVYYTDYPSREERGHCTICTRQDSKAVLFREVTNVVSPDAEPTPKDEPQSEPGYPTREEIIAKVRELRPKDEDIESMQPSYARECARGGWSICNAILAFAEPPGMTFGEAAGKVLSVGGRAVRRGRQETELRRGVADGCLFTRNLVESDTAETDWYIVKETP